MRSLRVDLHIHTTISDGTDTPEQLLSKVKAAGITLFSVTDHDSLKSAGVLKSFLTKDDPAFIPGVEFSCRDELGKYHILGYGYDPDNTDICDVVKRGHDLRMEKASARLDFIRDEFGFVFPEEEISAILSLDNPGKPHIGKLMVKYGYAENVKDAIKNYIDRLKLKNDHIGPKEAISGIIRAGGIPVLAHPFYGSGDELIVGDEISDRIIRLKGFGLMGIEAFYSGFSDKLRHNALALSDKYDLLITAGSDYHGSNKLVVLGDTGLSYDSELPDRLLQFFKAVRII